jgi:hypothetical protein
MQVTKVATHRPTAIGLVRSVNTILAAAGATPGAV